MVNLSYKLISPFAEAPYFATSGSACMDIKACLEEGKEITYYSNTYHNSQKRIVEGGMVRFEKGDRIMIPTGMILEIPVGYVGHVYPRSGNSIKRGFMLCNGVGVIDSDYRNELMILLYNSGLETFLHHGDRIAQFSLSSLVPVELVKVEKITKAGTERTGGMGSTGN